ncbi:VWA domain-containing protein [bacterium]|nr:VWA domain-containing protein [bacterium]
MRVYLLITILFCYGLSEAQYLDRTTVDFGKVEYWNNPIAEFTFTNTSTTEMVFLPTAYQRDIRVYVENKNLQPGESTTILVQYYTEFYGKFSETVTLYFGAMQEPVQLTLKGNIKSFDPAALTVCPTMEPSSKPNKPIAKHEIEVVDAETGKPIYSFDVKVSTRNNTYRELDESVSHDIQNFSPDLYYINIESPGYLEYDETLYINSRNSKTVIRLKKDESEPILVYEPVEEDPIPVQPEPELDTVPRVIADVPVIPEPEPPIDTAVVLPPVPQTELVDGQLNDALFKYNHMVFLIDVSSSMARDEKLALLKYSMYQMIEVLRPEDKVTIITYASDVNILVSAISGGDKAKLREVILGLEAKGQSHGSEGIEMAYDIALSQFIPGGNNEIILASDGRFNSAGFSEKKLYRHIARNYRREDIRFSAIGFGSQSGALDFMKGLAENGEGQFIHLLDENTAETVLIENVMKHSRKNEGF